MNRIVDNDGKFTQEGTQRILEHVRALDDTYLCCRQQKLLMKPSMYHFQASALSEDLLLNPLRRGYPVALVVCHSCGELRTLSLQIIFGNLFETDERKC